MKRCQQSGAALGLALLIGLLPQAAFAPLPDTAGGVNWVSGGKIPSTSFRQGGGAGVGGAGAGFNSAAGAFGAMAAMATINWALSGPSAAEQAAAKRKMAELDAERARLQALAEEQARKARIGSASRMRDSWDQQDKESRERLQGTFDVFRQFHSIDPFGDFLFHGVPIYRSEGGPLIIRHLDPNGLAARAEAWGKALEGAQERAQAAWEKIQGETEGPIGHSTPANQAGLQNTAGANEPGTGAGGTGGTPANPELATGNDAVPNQLSQQPAGQAQAPTTTGQAGQPDLGDGTLRHRTGAFGTREVTGVPGPEFNSSPFDTKVVDLRDRLTDIPRIPGSTPQPGRIGNIPVTQGTKVPMDRVVVSPPTILPKSAISVAANNVADKYYDFLAWYNDPMHRDWVNDAILIGTMPALFKDLLALGPTPKFTLSEFSEAILETDLMRRPGLGARDAAGFFQKGQMYDTEFEQMRRLAMDSKVDIPLVGGLIETPEGLAVRYDPANRGLLGFRGEGDKFMTRIIGYGPRDVDVPEFAGLKPDVLAKIREIFKVEKVDIDYSIKRYKDLSDLGNKCGYILFKADGTVERVLAPWQRAENVLRTSQWRRSILAGDL
jgi:hypothetical protein